MFLFRFMLISAERRNCALFTAYGPDHSLVYVLHFFFCFFFFFFFLLFLLPHVYHHTRATKQPRSYTGTGIAGAGAGAGAILTIPVPVPAPAPILAARERGRGRGRGREVAHTQKGRFESSGVLASSSILFSDGNG